MMKKYKNLILVAGALIIVLGITVLIFAALFSAPLRDRTEEITPEPIPEQNDTETPSTNQPQTSDGPPPFADSHNILDECITFKRATVSGSESSYSKGTILVTFEKNTSYNEALDLVKDNGHDVVSESEAEASFGSGKWFSVDVPSGEEYRWMCIFESSDLVARAAREPIFDLHQ